MYHDPDSGQDLEKSEVSESTPPRRRRMSRLALLLLLLFSGAVFELEIALVIHHFGFYGLRRELIQHYYLRGERGETFLIAVQDDPSSELRSRALRDLVKRLPELPARRRGVVHEALVVSLDDDPGPVVRAVALSGLASLGAPELLSRLPTLIEDPWLGILALEMTAEHPKLHRGRDTPAALESAIQRSLESPDPGRRIAARRALDAIAGP